MTNHYHADIAIIGGGLAAMVTACELLDQKRSVIILDKAPENRFGGLAKQSFGGITVFNSPLQRARRIQDSAELGLSDWLHTADFGPEDDYPKAWAEKYVYESPRSIYHWLRDKKVRFFPFIHWVERGLFQPGNSVPRFHMVWGTGSELVKRIAHYLDQHPYRHLLTLLFEHEVQALSTAAGQITGCSGTALGSQATFEVHSQHTVIASGGICGSLTKVRQHWHKSFGSPPDVMLNGSHEYADGMVHDIAAQHGAQLTHLDNQWHYAAGVHHPKPQHPHHGLSLIPPKSALWLNARGKRIGPIPLVTSFDTRFLVEEVCKQEEKYSWQVMNLKIARRELAVSGSEYNDAIRDKKWLAFITSIITGNKKLVKSLMDNCPDFVTANSPRALADKMNQLCGNTHVDPETLEQEIQSYDAMIARGGAFATDDQLRRIQQTRHYLGDRLRTCNLAKINDSKNLPLIAIREFIVTRKSLGGIKTSLNCEVLDDTNTPIPGLWAVGEAAGFGGGGIHGRRTLEGTFLGSCILTGVSAGQHLGQSLHS